MAFCHRSCALLLLMATLTTRSMLVSAAPQEGRLGLGSLLRPKQPSRPELSTSSPAGDAARYLDSSAKVFDSVVPGNFAEKLLPKFDNNGKDKVCYEHVGCFCGYLYRSASSTSTLSRAGTSSSTTTSTMLAEVRPWTLR